MVRRVVGSIACCLIVASSARAQGIHGELVSPGSTLATATDADAARVNPGAVPLVRAFSGRLTGVAELRGQNTALDGAALTLVAPLPFDLGVSAAVTWQHVLAPAARGDVVTGELGLGATLAPGLGVGARLRVLGAGGDPVFIPVANGAAALDLGLAWRPLTWLALGLAGRNLLGPQLPAIGMVRAGVVGVGLRPVGTDAITLGVDASYAQDATGWVRAGARVRVPYVGYVRAEGVVDLPSTAWRASAGLEVDLGVIGLGGGVLFGDSTRGLASGPLGGWASVRFSAERERGIPEGGVVMTLPVAALGPREMVHLLVALERATHDPAVRGVLFEPRGDVGGLAHAEELREAFDRLRAAGRHVACHLVEPNGGTYYACGGAETLSMDPAGSLRSAGLRTTFVFLGDTLRDLGVRTQFLRIGTWKSAPEQFTRRSSSPEGRAQEEQLVDDLYAHFIDGLARSRSAAGHAIVADAMRARIEAGPYTARGAREAGLVDVLATRERAEQSFARSIGAGVGVVEWTDRTALVSPRWARGRSVAVLTIAGDIIEGESFDVPVIDLHFVGDRTVRTALEELVDDPSVAAIVLRVDSSGGAALAAENLWRAVQRAARRKPVVVSMGREAASAAYYLAAPAAEIVADPSSVTGSIGIFFGKVDIGPLLTRFDVGVEVLRRGERADIDSMYRAWTEDEQILLGRMLEENYEQFLVRVATGRHMTTDAVHRVGEGRVFAGSRARGLGLVDRVGGLWTAIERARALAHLDDDSDVREIAAGPTGLLETLVSLASARDARHPAERLLAGTEAMSAMRWMYSVALSRGRPLAMTDCPMVLP